MSADAYGAAAERLDAAIGSGATPRLHGVAVVLDGDVVVERYGTGEDWSWGDPLGVVAFGPDVLHDLRSVSKSVVSLLYGIALERGLVPPPDDPLLASFPEYPDLVSDPRRSRLRIEHALTMSLGLEWNEDVPYTDETNSEIAMEFAPDRYRFVLGRPVVEEPGRRWTYCGGATALLGALIERGAGISLPEFARAVLFEPLGIERFAWLAGDDGVASPASGLRLTPRDLARIGRLMLDAGRWNGTPVVPEAWVRAATRPHLEIDDETAYGYQWYLARVPAGALSPEPVPAVVAMGNGGQRLYVVPDLRLVVAITAGNYDMGSTSSETPAAVLRAVLGTED
jgi:CubicO group peptidase (beta-lactamase class C family)